jgi:putative transposase
VDETYIRVRGRWTYLYRAVDRDGLTVDFMLSEHRDITAAKRFFSQAIERHGAPERITLDGYPATHAAARGVEGEWGDSPGGEGLDKQILE